MDLRPLGSVHFRASPAGIFRRYPFCPWSCLLRRSWSRRRCHWYLPNHRPVRTEVPGDRRGPFPIKVADHRCFSYLTCCIPRAFQPLCFGLPPGFPSGCFGVCDFLSRLFQPAESIMPSGQDHAQPKTRNPHVVNSQSRLVLRFLREILMLSTGIRSQPVDRAVRFACV